VADLADPILTRHRLAAGPGDAGLAERLAALSKGQDRRVLREIVIALGRLRWAGLPEWLRQGLGQPDPALAHAAVQALRRSENWSAILKLLDEPGDVPLRAIALRAIAEQFEPKVVDGLIERLGMTTEAARRREYADALTRVYKKPGPWVYWGYRPGPRPANTAAWERTEAIAQALDRVLAGPDRAVRLAVLQRMQREKVPVRLATLTRWLEEEDQPERVAALLVSLGEQPAAEVRRSLEAVVGDRRHSAANRLLALASFIAGLGEADPAPLLVFAQKLEDGPVLAEVLRRTAKYPRLPAASVLASKLSSPDAEVRAAAIETLGELRSREGEERILALVQDKDVRVRRAAAGAAGKLGARQVIDPLLKLIADADPSVRRASLDSLRLLREPRAVPLAVAALADRELELKALEYLGELGGPEQTGAVVELAKKSPSADVLAATVRVLTAWRDRKGLEASQKALDNAVAQVHGAHGILMRWQATGDPFPGNNLPPALLQPYSHVGATPFHDERTLFATGTEGRVLLAPRSDPKATWLAYTNVMVAEATPVEFLGSSSGSLHVWLNGKVVHQRDQVREFRPDSERFPGTLVKGDNRVLVQISPASAAVQFQLRFRRKSSTAEHERLTQAVLTRAGNAERGRQLFFNVEKSLCLKCHRLGTQGEGIGPELTGVGNRFSRIYLVESILEPSRTIAPSFGTLLLTLKNGKTLTGVKVAETEKTLTLADNQGQKHTLSRGDIEEQQASPLSTMPEGLEKRFTEAEFLDLIAFLVSQKESQTR
jgi:putative heme-binding domain-containing protein